MQRSPFVRLRSAVRTTAAPAVRSGATTPDKPLDGVVHRGASVWLSCRWFHRRLLIPHATVFVRGNGPAARSASLRFELVSMVSEPGGECRQSKPLGSRQNKTSAAVRDRADGVMETRIRYDADRPGTLADQPRQRRGPVADFVKRDFDLDKSFHPPRTTLCTVRSEMPTASDIRSLRSSFVGPSQRGYVTADALRFITRHASTRARARCWSRPGAAVPTRWKLPTYTSRHRPLDLRPSRSSWSARDAVGRTHAHDLYTRR